MSSECEDARQRQAMCGRRWQVLQATCFEVGSHAGREDLDVRMLGSGRPFVLELADARGAMPPQSRLQELQEQLAALGAGVEVLKMQAAPKSILKAIKVRAPD